jgi:hypothetical protein
MASAIAILMASGMLSDNLEETTSIVGISPRDTVSDFSFLDLCRGALGRPSGLGGFGGFTVYRP